MAKKESQKDLKKKYEDNQKGGRAWGIGAVVALIGALAFYFWFANIPEGTQAMQSTALMWIAIGWAVIGVVCAVSMVISFVTSAKAKSEFNALKAA